MGNLIIFKCYEVEFTEINKLRPFKLAEVIVETSSTTPTEIKG